jgi:hypothetical protein
LKVDFPATGACRRRLAGQHRHSRVMPQFAGIIEVFAAKRDPEDSLPKQATSTTCSR